MKVLILGKTRMKKEKCCIGAITQDGQSVRLLTAEGYNQPEDTPFEVLQVWDVDFNRPSTAIPPYVEDVRVQRQSLSRPMKKGKKVIDVLRGLKIPIWEGGPTVLFDGLIEWERSDVTVTYSGYISRTTGHLPQQSVGFWISDKSLTRGGSNLTFSSDLSDWQKKLILAQAGQYGLEKDEYFYYEKSYRLKFVGFQPMPDELPAGTLLRVSLARWWSYAADTEEKCFLQLSGYYDI
jgi:hypothetical protein